MDKQKLYAILLIIIGLFLFIGIVYIIFFHNFGEEGPQLNISKIEQKSKEDNTTVITETTVPITKPYQEKNIKIEFGENDLKRMAANFAERFGTYSNQSDFGHLTDLKIFMSSEMKNWADEYIDQEIVKKNNTGIYYAITTKVVATSIKSFDSSLGTAEVSVETRRREASGAESNFIDFNQTLILNYLKENNVWKVSSAVWQDK